MFYNISFLHDPQRTGNIRSGISFISASDHALDFLFRHVAYDEGRMMRTSSATKSDTISVS